MIDCPDCGDPYPADQLDGHQIEDHPAHIVNATLCEICLEPFPPDELDNHYTDHAEATNEPMPWVAPYADDITEGQPA